MGGPRDALKEGNALTSNLSHKICRDCKNVLAPPYRCNCRSRSAFGATAREPEIGTDALAPPARCRRKFTADYGRARRGRRNCGEQGIFRPAARAAAGSGGGHLLSGRPRGIVARGRLA